MTTEYEELKGFDIDSFFFNFDRKSFKVKTLGGIVYSYCAKFMKGS